MATQQAWDDFKIVKSVLEQSLAEASAIKDLATRLESIMGDLEADPPRLAAAAALADTHYKWTAAAIVEAYNKLLALRTHLINQGM